MAGTAKIPPHTFGLSRMATNEEKEMMAQGAEAATAARVIIRAEKDEQLMERAFERLVQLRDDPTLDQMSASANGLAYVIEDLEKRLKK